MPDLLVRGVPETVVDSYQLEAERLRVSRNEALLMGLMRSEPRTPARAQTLERWHRFLENYQDLADPDVMSGAWR